MTCRRYDRSTLKKLRRLVSAQHNEIIKLTLQRDFALAHLLTISLKHPHALPDKMPSPSMQPAHPSES